MTASPEQGSSNAVQPEALDPIDQINAKAAEQAAALYPEEGIYQNIAREVIRVAELRRSGLQVTGQQEI